MRLAEADAKLFGRNVYLARSAGDCQGIGWPHWGGAILGPG